MIFVILFGFKHKIFRRNLNKDRIYIVLFNCKANSIASYAFAIQFENISV